MFKANAMINGLQAQAEVTIHSHKDNKTAKSILISCGSRQDCSAKPDGAY